MHLIFLLIHIGLFTSCEKKATDSAISLKGLEKKVIKIAKKGNLPSISVHIRTDTEVIAFNYHHPDTEKQTLYGIGSTTKLLSATLIFKMVEDGKLSLKDKVADYVERLAEIEGGSSITVGNLMNHTSGLADYTAHPDWRAAVVNGQGPEEFDRKLELINPVLEGMGEYMYSNSNYLLLQEIVEKVVSEPFDTAFNEFLKNQGLPNLRLGHEDVNLQAFYATNDKASSNVSAWEENYGYDGGAYGTPQDLDAFLKKLFIEKTLIEEETIFRMKDWIPMGSMSIPIGKGSINTYGYGLMKLEYRDKEYVGHAGGTLKYQSFMFYDLKNKTTISVVTNCSGKHYNNIFFQEIIPEILDNL